MRKFGEKIKELRVTQDLGLFDTARILGIAPDSLNRIERGEEDPPSPEVVRALAKLLAADPEDLLRLRRLCQQLAVLQPNLRGVFELLLEACASSHDDRDLSDEQVTRIEQFIRREVLMSIENLVPSRSHETQILQWTGDNFDEVLTWVKDLNRDINLDISKADSPALEIPDRFDGILRVNMYDYIIRDLDNILDILHPSQLIN